eukprot:GILI01012778.1.p1 GENE.GILI01012778.1~~GILI01012778.1.p1  ORF type:complete len:103 (+),score=12.99 GILI01012778.1:160-468(+)
MLFRSFSTARAHYQKRTKADIIKVLSAVRSLEKSMNEKFVKADARFSAIETDLRDLSKYKYIIAGAFSSATALAGVAFSLFINRDKIFPPPPPTPSPNSRHE